MSIRAVFTGLIVSCCILVASGCGVQQSVPIITPGTPTPLGMVSGHVHGGQQPLVGAQVYLYAVSAQNGGTATSLLNTPGFVLSDLNGNFTITNDYSCPAGAYVYLLAVGGNPGLGVGTNSEIALTAGLGSCASLSASSFFTVNEVTTAAFAYAMSAYASTDTQVGTTANLAAAFTYINTIVNPATGAAVASHDGLTLPQQTLNTLANALAACVNSSGSGTPCSTLMSASNASPANTFQAALKIAQSPGANVSAIYSLTTANAVFQPTLSTAPTSWTLLITLSSGQIFADANTYAFTTPVGTMCVELRPDVAPLTVANFRYYVNNGSYSNNMFLHRSVANFVIQGGGYDFINGNVEQIPTTTPVTNEFNLSNVRGTLAMAKLSSDPNSATDQFFFNDQDNSGTLDTQDGGFTVFGSIVGVAGYTGTNGCSSASGGLAVMDAINTLPILNAGSPLDSLPVINYTSGPITTPNLVITAISTANPQ